MGYAIALGQTAEPLLFLMVSSVDHIAPKTGLSPTVTISKNGGAFAVPAGAVTEIGNGWYKVAGNATDSDTLGPLLLHATGSGADPTDEQYDVALSTASSTPGGGASGVAGSVTCRSLISSALRLIGVLAAGDEVEGVMAADALVTLSQMLDSWSTERLTIYAQTRTVHALTISDQQYTIGSSGDFTEARPLWIDGFGLVIGSEESEIAAYTRDEWRRIGNKSQTGYPAGAFYRPDYPLGTIDVWPIPDAACSLAIYAPAASLTAASALSTVLTAPPGWLGALRYNLAVELAPEYDVLPSPIVMQFAIDKKAAIKRTNTPDDLLTIDDALLRPRGLNLSTGEPY